PSSSCSSDGSGCVSSSATDDLGGASRSAAGRRLVARDQLGLLGVDLLERPALLDPADLTLGRVRRGYRQRDAQLVGDRADPFDQALELRTGGPDLVGGRVEQAARAPVADPPPKVF